MIDVVKDKLKNILKKKNLIIILIFFFFVLISFSFAYLAIFNSDSAVTDTNVVTGKSSSLTFSQNNDSLNIFATQDNFAEGKGNLSDSTTGSATLVSSKSGETLTSNYNVYIDVKSNNFVYTQNNTVPEIILKVTGPDGEIKSIDGLSYTSSIDAKTGETITGFDITTHKGLIKIKENEEISTNDNDKGITENWKIEIILLNLSTNQNENAGKEFSANLLMQEEIYNEQPITGEKVYATVSGGTTNISGITKMTYASMDHTQMITNKNEADPWVLNPHIGIYFLKYDVSDSLIKKEHSKVEVTIEYLDEGTGSFYIIYNSSAYNANVTSSNIGNIFLNNSASGTTVDLNVSLEYDNQRKSDLVILENTGEWKSKTFILDYAYFNNALDGYDFAITNQALGEDYSFPTTLSIRNVTAQSIGEIIYEETEANLLYNITDLSNDDILLENVENINKDSSSSSNFTISTKIDRNSSYEIDFSISGKSYTVESSLFSVMSSSNSSVSNSDFFGVCTHFGLPWFYESVEIKSNITGLSNTGWIRDEIRWSEVEKVKGVLEIPAISDEYIDSSIDKGIEPLLILAYGNDFYDGGGVPYTEEGLKAFETYITKVVTHFKGRVSHFEIWNEYNHPAFNSTSRPTEDYVQLLELAYNTIKKIIPDAVVIGGAMAIDYEGIPEEWFREILDGGALNYMDAVSYHPYSTTPEYGQFYQSITAMNNVMSDYGKVLPIWITEVGWPVTDKQYSATEKDSAEYLVRSYVLGNAAGIERIFWYDLINDGTNSSYEEHNFGLIRNWYDYKTPLAVKLPFLAFNTASSQLSNLEFVEFISEPNLTTYPNLMAVKFKKISSSESVVVAWSTFTDTEISLTTSSSSVTVTDIYSNSYTVNAQSGKINIPVTSSPVFIEGLFY